MENAVDLKDEEQRKLFEEMLGKAIDTWLDKQYASIGKWSVRGIIAMLIAAFTYFYLSTKGFRS